MNKNKLIVREKESSMRLWQLHKSMLVTGRKSDAKSECFHRKKNGPIKYCF